VLHKASKKLSHVTATAAVAATTTITTTTATNNNNNKIQLNSHLLT
jgi:hypothetical protein